MLLVRVIVAKV